MRNFFLIFCFAFFLIGCTSSVEESVTPQMPIAEPEPEPNDFLEELIRLARKYSINRKTINWATERTRVYEAFENEGKRAAILEYLSVLDDNHSFYEGEGSFVYAGEACAESSPDYVFDDLPSDIGYVQVLGTRSSSQDFADAIRAEIIRQNTPDKKGWVVDLSKNTGGNMYPMLAGLSPLLDEGIIGYFIDPDNEEVYWEQNQGVISLMEWEIFTMPGDFELRNPEAKIAVVYGGTTGSSGEATLIAFLGSENVRTFGRPSCGVSTANQAFNLSDGGTLYMTVSTMADKNKTLYGGVIAPDVEASNTEELIPAVVEWIRE